MEGGGRLEVVGLPSGEPAVEGNGAYADAAGDLGDREGAIAEKRLGELYVFGVVKLGRLPPAVAVLSVGGDAGAGAFRHDLTFHLREGGDDGEHGFADGAAGVDAFGEAEQLDFKGMKALDEVDQVGDAAAEPVEAPDDEGVVGAQGIEEAVELGALAAAAGSVIGIDAVAAGVLQGIDLQLRVLVSGGDAGVA